MSYKTIIEDWINNVQIDLISNYNQMGLKASGKWANTLENETKETQKGYSTSISGQRYTGALVLGRKPNTNQENLKEWIGWAGSTFIAEWVKNKGLTLNPYAVAGKIAKQGITVPNTYNDGELLSRVVTKQRVDELGKELGRSVLNGFKSELIKELK